MTVENATDSGTLSVVSGTRIRVCLDPVRVGAPNAPPHGEPKVQLVREDGVVRAVDITCGCGEKIRIRCDYG